MKVSARIREKEEAGKGDSLLWIDVRVVDEVWVDVGRHVGGECGWEKTGRMEESRKTDAECNLARNSLRILYAPLSSVIRKYPQAFVRPWAFL